MDLIINEKFAVNENNISIQIATMQIEKAKFCGNYLTFAGTYDYGDEDIITRWLGYVLMDEFNGSDGCLIDWVNFHYYGGDKFLAFFHILLSLKIDISYEGKEFINFFPKNIAFLTNPTTKANILTLLLEDFYEEEVARLSKLFFEDRTLALMSLM